MSIEKINGTQIDNGLEHPSYLRGSHTIVEPGIETPLSPEILASNHVIFIVGLTPGSGSRSIAKRLSEVLGADHIDMRKVAEREEFTEGSTGVRRFSKRYEDPLDLDRDILSSLPEGRVVIDGKAISTLAGDILKDRPYTIIYTHTNPVDAAIRVYQHEGGSIRDLLLNPDVLTEQLRRVEDYRKMEEAMLQVALPQVDAVQRYPIQMVTNQLTSSNLIVVDTSLAATDEIIEGLTQKNIVTHEREFEILASELGKINALLLSITTDPRVNMDFRDRDHIRQTLQAIEYKLQHRFWPTFDPLALGEIRRDIRKSWISVLYPIYRLLPHFYIDEQNEVIADTKSSLWAPEFYKIATARDIIKARLTGKKVFDPYGGAGMMMMYLASEQIPAKIYLGDLSYPGGKPLLPDRNIQYHPELNMQLYSSLADGLPGFYRPRVHERIDEFITMDANHPPFGPGDKDIDIIFTDPPYGKNLPDGGIGGFLVALPGLLNLTREGGIFLIPMEWLPILQDSAQARELEEYNFIQLSGDLSLNQSKIPTCLVMFGKKEQSN